ncbi:uncharacterized protein [Nothobranchius furzeri]|uniref:uncharacterized protein isoform X1 n=1 Tax=Nothobranchius furzeri TaxID=105023 RepID=UPI003904BB72
MDETRQNLSCTVTPDVRFSDVLLPEHAKTQETVHRPSIAGPSARPNGPILGGCRRSGTVRTGGCGSVPAALGGHKPTINIKAEHLSSMGVKSSGCDPPLQSEVCFTRQSASCTNQLLYRGVMGTSAAVKHLWSPDGATMPFKGFVPGHLDLYVNDLVTFQFVTSANTVANSFLLSQGCDLVSGLCALFPVISLTGDHDDAENPAGSSSQVVSGDIEGSSVVAAIISLTGPGVPPGPGGIGACSGALLGAPPDKRGVPSGTDFSVADFRLFGGNPPPSGRVIAGIDTDLPPIQLTTLTSDPELGAAPSTGRNSSQSVTTLVKPGFSDSVWEPP